MEERMAGAEQKRVRLEKENEKMKQELRLMKSHSSGEDHDQSHSNGSSSKRHVLFLAKTWGCSDDGSELSSIIKEMAVNFAETDKVRVSCLVAHSGSNLKCEAKKLGVDLFEAVHAIGFSTQELPFLPPDSLVDVDVIIGCGEVVGRQVQIVRNRFAESKWVHIACASQEENENENENERQLCKHSDLAYAFGRGAASAYERHVQKNVNAFTPGILRELGRTEQNPEQVGVFSVIAFYPSVKECIAGEESYSIPAKAVGMLSDEKYQLIAVCAPQDEADDLKRFIQQQEAPHHVLKVWRYSKGIEMGRQGFMEADLLILPFLPSTSEGFGFIGLQALSAGLPILVSRDSGLGEALAAVRHGDSCIVSSGKPDDWKKWISIVKGKKKSMRLKEIGDVRRSYDEEYSWRVQCDELLDNILHLLTQ